MTVQVYSDFICPWCYISWRKIETILANLSEMQRPVVTWLAYQLDPKASSVPSVTAVEAMMGWYASEQEAKRRMAEIISAGAKAGLTLRLDLARPVNTMNAHRVAKLADLEGVGEAIREALFRSYHVDGGNIAERDHLMFLAQRSGIDPEKTKQWLDDDRTRDSVQTEHARALHARVKSVPSIVIKGAEPFSAIQMADRLPSLLTK